MHAVNAPNALTVLRILLVPVLVVVLLAGEAGSDAGDAVAAVLFAVAAITDTLDGHLARAQGTVTTFGKLMDPVADKLLVAAALVTLVSVDRLPAWAAALIIAREVAVTVARAQADEVIPAAAWGKAKTTVQLVVILLLIAVGTTPPWLEVLVYVMVAITLISGADFFVTLRRAQTARAAARVV